MRCAESCDGSDQAPRPKIGLGGLAPWRLILKQRALAAHAELDLPALVRLAGRERDGFEQERADRRDLRREPHGHDVALAPALGGQRHFDRRQLLQLAALPALELRAHGVVATDARAVEVE